MAPAPVLDAGHVLVRRGAGGGPAHEAFARRHARVLYLQSHFALAERERRREEQRALVVEALERVEAAVRRAVAVGPVVVAGSQDRRRVERIEEALRLLI